MKTKTAESTLKNILKSFNNHPTHKHFKITKEWESNLKKIIDFLLFFISDIEIDKKVKNQKNKLINLKKSLSDKESLVKKLKNEEKDINLKIKILNDELDLIKKYNKIKKEWEEYREVIEILKNHSETYEVIKKQSGKFLSSMENIKTTIKEAENFIKDYIQKTDKENKNKYTKAEN